MFKSKHSGWTWDLRRTPFGGGGGIISAITDPISSALGTDGSGGGLLGAVDSGVQAIGSGLASVDSAVNNAIPGGWATVGGAALLAAGITDPTLLAAADSGTLSDSTIAAAGLDPSTVASDVASSGTGLTGGTGGSTGILTGGSTSGLTVPTGSAIAVDPSIAAGTGADLSAAGTTSTGAATGAGLSGISGLNPALPAAGANAGAGTGLSAALAPNTVLGTGLAGGGDIGVAYQLGANGLPATDWLGNPIQASSIGLNGSTAASSLSNTLPNPTQLATAIKNLGAATQKNATQSLPTVNYQSSFLPNSQAVPIEGSRLTTTPTALKLASLLYYNQNQ
jgi:hypothetical protein